MRLRSLVVLAIASLLAACASGPKFQPTTPSPRPVTARPAAEVEVRTELPAGNTHVEIGYWEVAAASLPHALDAMRGEAGRRGCELLVASDAGSQGIVGGRRLYRLRCLVAR